MKVGGVSLITANSPERLRAKRFDGVRNQPYDGNHEGRRFHVEIDDQGVAWIAGANTKVIEVVLDKSAYGWSLEEMHFQHPHLSLAQIHAALAFYYEHQEELESDIPRHLHRWMDKPALTLRHRLSDRRKSRAPRTDRRLRFSDYQRWRLAAKAKKLGRKMLAQVVTIVTPQTLLAWHRKLIANKYDGSAQPCVGRPRTAADTASLVTRMAEENRDWGYRRIQGALTNLGHLLAHNTIVDILRRHGIEPVPERIRKTTWKEFLQRHWEQIVASDFFTIGEDSLRNPVRHFLEHYHGERNHQGLGNVLIVPIKTAGESTGAVQCPERLGGLLKYYYFDAA